MKSWWLGFFCLNYSKTFSIEISDDLDLLDFIDAIDVLLNEFLYSSIFFQDDKIILYKIKETRVILN